MIFIWGEGCKRLCARTHITSAKPKVLRDFGQGSRVRLKVLGKSVGLCTTTKRKDQLYISLFGSVWRIICENFNPNGLILAEI